MHMRHIHRHKRLRHYSPVASGVQSAVWMIGLGILFLTGDWWPGIMILIGVSMVMGALARGWAALDAAGEPQPEPPGPPPSPFEPRPAPPASPPAFQAGPAPRPAVRVPNLCPSCGAPTRSRPTDEPGICGYCGSDIALRSS
jgi:hypothetical protein